MCQRIRSRGYTILHIDKPMTGHDLAMTRWSQYWRRALRAGYAYAEISERFTASGLQLWRTESRRNLVNGVLLLAATGGGLLGALALRSFIPLALVAVSILLLGLRTERRVRWKSPDFSTRLLYGLHSHLQQIPILFGQFRYWRDRRKGRVGSLIDYKTEACDREGGTTNAGGTLSRGDVV
jgi:hypothetical protein